MLIAYIFAIIDLLEVSFNKRQKKSNTVMVIKDTTILQKSAEF